ncbi:uncharacterized protein LOC144411911 [Styela clava]
MENTLAESADILLKMGEIYLEKATTTSGMLQKLNFIKCAALLHGSRVRFEDVLGHLDQGKKVRQMIKLMNSKLLQECHAQKLDIDLMEISTTKKLKLDKWREVEKLNIKEKLLIIADDLPEHLLLEKRSIKGQIVRNMLWNNTQKFTWLMSSISSQCIDILGKPPCKYAVAGLGSLARKEITLYSDFEHVIVLEEKIQDLPEYNNVKEYFRWFSVLFQIIVIGFGETLIRSVGVKSINDLYSENQTQNWFYDTFTPRGVAFDGRVPHSCNTPLGKQEPSRYRKHIVELIQPVSKMVSYLTSEEHIKNGYYLKDILVRTHFVQGFYEVYDQFKKQSRTFLQNKNRDLLVKEYVENLIKNVNRNLSGSRRFQVGPNEQAKDRLYRPLTTWLSYMANLFGGMELTSFALIDTLIEYFENASKKSKVTRRNSDVDIEKYYKDVLEYVTDLRYAFTVANEIRIKVYASGERNRRNTTNIDFSKFAGRKCLLLCNRIMTASFHMFTYKKIDDVDFVNFGMKMFQIAKIYSSTKENRHHYDLLLKQYGFDIQHKQLLQNICTDSTKPWDLAEVYWNFAQNCDDKFEKEEYITKLEKILKNCEEQKPGYFTQMMCTIHYFREQYSECLKLAEIWIERQYDEAKTNEDFIKSENFIFMRNIQVQALQKCMETKAIIIYSNKCIAEHTDGSSQLLFRSVIVNAYIRMKNFCQAQKILQESFEICQADLKNIPTKFLLVSLNKIIEIQRRRNWIEDALKSVEFQYRLRESNIKQTIYNDALANLAHLPIIMETPMPDKKRIDYVCQALNDFRVAYNRGHKSVHIVTWYAGLLATLLLHIHDVSKYKDYFSQAPMQVLRHPVLYGPVDRLVKRFTKNILDGGFHKVYLQLADLLDIFDNFTYHSCFYLEALILKTWTYANIVQYPMGMTKEKTVSLMNFPENDHVLLNWFHSEKNDLTLMYIQALECLRKCDVRGCSIIVWNILQSDHGSSSLKAKCCHLLLHAADKSRHSALYLRLKSHRKNFVALYSINFTTDASIEFNCCIKIIEAGQLTNAASGFWNLLCKEKHSSILRNRCAHMLMYVVFCKLTTRGFIFQHKLGFHVKDLDKIEESMRKGRKLVMN